MTPSRVFVSYAHEDEKFRKELLKHLRLIEKQGYVECWHDREITAGEEWRGEIDQHLRDADIILLLVSTDFVNSEYCYDVEMKMAIDAHKANKSLTIPILVRPVANWEEAPFGELQALPTNTKPVSNWDYQDAAWADVVAGILSAVQRREQEQIPRDSRNKPNFDQVIQNVSTDHRASEVKKPEVDKSLSENDKAQLLYSIPMMANKMAAYHANQKSYNDAAKMAHSEIMGQVNLLLPFELKLTLLMSKLLDILHKKITLDIQRLSIVQTIENANLPPHLLGWPSHEEMNQQLEIDMKNREQALNGLIYLTVESPQNAEE